MNFYKTVILIMCAMVLCFCSCKTSQSKAVITCVLPNDKPEKGLYLYEVNMGDKITRLYSNDKCDNGDYVEVEVRLKKVGTVYNSEWYVK